MQSRIIIDLRLLNARHRARSHEPGASDYIDKLLPMARPERVRAVKPTDASSTWNEWLAMPTDRPSRRFGFDA